MNAKMITSTISGINLLSSEEKRRIYSLLIPPELTNRCGISPSFMDKDGNDLLNLACREGSSSAEMALYHKFGFPDPILYGHITDTLNGRPHILLYILNDPDSPRFDVDRMPDGSPTKFGTSQRNLPAEQAAMQFGLAPGQVRRGLRLLGKAIGAFEHFVEALGQDLFFAEPLYYHSAILFERYGFAYEKGKRLMEKIQAGFQPGGSLLPLLDGSSPFRSPQAASSIRLRSWAIHDQILGEPYTDVTMYKRIGKMAGVNTSPNCQW